jgi:glutamate decarboxylase
MLPAYTMPPKADKVRMMRALVKLTLGRTLVDKLADDLAEGITILEKRGGLDEHARKRAPTGTGY